MDHRPRKRYGQHFLIDELVIDDVVSLIAPRPHDHIIEIGPGTGALTKPLMESGIELDVIEIDRDLVARLKLVFGENSNLKVHSGDALRFDFASLVRAGRKLRFVGNLPYKISTPLLLRLFAHRHCIVDMIFMLQKEVVDRLVAEPGNRDYGRLTVIAQYLCDVEAHFDVAPESFDPPPRVWSSIMTLRPRLDQSGPMTFEWFSEIVRRAFSQRRKTIRNTLGVFLGEEVLERCEIDGALRPEQLSVQDFARLATATDTHETRDGVVGDG